MLLAVHTAGAATITVTITADSGAGTMRAAFAGAANGDTIDAAGISGAILLTSGELLVTNSLTILGSGPASLGSKGRGWSPLFLALVTCRERVNPSSQRKTKMLLEKIR